MNAQGLLDKIEDILEMGSKIPLSGKVAVDADAIKQCIEDIRYDLPAEIQKAQEIVSHHNDLITKANNEASSIVSSAQTEADGIVAAANGKAQDIALTAETNAKSTIAAANERAKQIVENSEVSRMAQEYADRVHQQASTEAEKILRNAKSQADAIILDANNQADSVKAKAEKWSTEIRAAATEFVEGIMKNSDDVLSSNIAEIRKARQSLFGGNR